MVGVFAAIDRGLERALAARSSGMGRNPMNGLKSRWWVMTSRVADVLSQATEAVFEDAEVPREARIF